jgi:hypothetical protein
MRSLAHWQCRQSTDLFEFEPLAFQRELPECFGSLLTYQFVFVIELGQVYVLCFLGFHDGEFS